MRPYINPANAIRRLTQENDRLRAENTKLRGDVDYVAIMADIDLETDEETMSEMSGTEE